MQHQDDEPKPVDYGLDNKTIEILSDNIPDESLYVSILMWIFFFVFFVLIPPPFLQNEGQQFLLLLYFLPGAFIGEVSFRLWLIIRRIHQTHNKLYKNYLQYREAHEKWHEGYFEKSRIEREKEYEIKKKQYEEHRKNLEWWRSLNGKQFEKEVMLLLKTMGLEVQLTPYQADGGVDIYAKDGIKKIIIQCKAHKAYINPGVIRELYGTMIHNKADEAWLITTSGFYQGAKDFAYNKPIKLITIDQLLKNQLQK